jgi:hypothetical protein
MRNYSDTQMTPYLVDQTILELRKRGYSYRAIGRAVSMSPSSVHAAYRRLAAGGPGTRAR